MTSEEFCERVDFGLELAYRKMLKEKALNNEDIIVCKDGSDEIVRIPAKQVLAELPPLQEPPEYLRKRFLEQNGMLKDLFCCKLLATASKTKSQSY